jgi:hypothetical protein
MLSSCVGWAGEECETGECAEHACTTPCRITQIAEISTDGDCLRIGLYSVGSELAEKPLPRRDGHGPRMDTKTAAGRLRVSKGACTNQGAEMLGLRCFFQFSVERGKPGRGHLFHAVLAGVDAVGQ